MPRGGGRANPSPMLVVYFFVGIFVFFLGFESVRVASTWIRSVAAFVNARIASLVAIVEKIAGGLAYFIRAVLEIFEAVAYVFNTLCYFVFRTVQATIGATRWIAGLPTTIRDEMDRLEKTPRAMEDDRGSSSGADRWPTVRDGASDGDRLDSAIGGIEESTISSIDGIVSPPPDDAPSDQSNNSTIAEISIKKINEIWASTIDWTYAFVDGIKMTTMWITDRLGRRTIDRQLLDDEDSIGITMWTWEKAATVAVLIGTILAIKYGQRWKRIVEEKATVVRALILRFAPKFFSAIVISVHLTWIYVRSLASDLAAPFRPYIFSRLPTGNNENATAIASVQSSSIRPSAPPLSLSSNPSTPPLDNVEEIERQRILRMTIRDGGFNDRRARSNEHLDEQQHQPGRSIHLGSDRSRSSDYFDDDRLLCVVCLDREKEMMVERCKHLCLCRKCADGMMADAKSSTSSFWTAEKKKSKRTCPICRGAIDRLVPVHF